MSNDIVPVSQAKMEHWMITQPDPVALTRSFSTIYGDEIRRKDMTMLSIPRYEQKVKPKWTLSLLGKQAALDSLEGIIVGFPPTQRAYWKQGYSPNNISPPSCISRDGVRGVGDPGGQCAPCPMNQWGSARQYVQNSIAGENRKACAERIHIYLWIPNVGRLPYLLDVPPSSIDAFRSFRRELFSAGLEPQHVVTRLNLAPDGSGEHTVIKVEPEVVNRLGEDELAVANAFSQAINEFIPKDVFEYEQPAPTNNDPDPLDEEPLDV